MLKKRTPKNDLKILIPIQSRKTTDTDTRETKPPVDVLLTNLLRNLRPRPQHLNRTQTDANASNPRNPYSRVNRKNVAVPTTSDTEDTDDIVSGVSVLLTCFENDQALLLQDLNLGATHATAYDAVIVHRRVDTHTVAYVLPPLLENKQGTGMIWALLEGTPFPSREAIVFDTDGNTETLTLQTAHEKLRDAHVYIGINLAVVPLSETHREMIRTALLRLRKTFGDKLHIRKLQADVLADWPTQTRNTRNDIWKQTFHSVS